MGEMQKEAESQEELEDASKLESRPGRALEAAM